MAAMQIWHSHADMKNKNAKMLHEKQIFSTHTPFSLYMRAITDV